MTRHLVIVKPGRILVVPLIGVMLTLFPRDTAEAGPRMAWSDADSGGLRWIALEDDGKTLWSQSPKTSSR